MASTSEEIKALLEVGYEYTCEKRRIIILPKKKIARLNN